MKCFVIMPFGNPRVDVTAARRLERIYTQWIKPAVESVTVPGGTDRISCYRADQQSRPDEIIIHIVEQLATADIVIADLSGKNPNVFYELGVRHALCGRTILISENIDDIPFDLRGLRAIAYTYEPEQMLALGTSLKLAISEILSDFNRLDNPVARFLQSSRADIAHRSGVTSNDDSVSALRAEILSVREQLRNSSQQMKEIAGSITEWHDQLAPKQNDESRIEFLEGVWYDSMSRSIFCGKLVHGELMMPYAYGDASEMTALLFGWFVLGKDLFCRFTWCKQELSGYVHLRTISDTRLEGGWWLEQDVPQTVRTQDVSKASSWFLQRKNDMAPMTLVKTGSIRDFPVWSRRYFEDPKLLPLRSGKGQFNRRGQNSA
jgi:hypothetical protein